MIIKKFNYKIYIKIYIKLFIKKMKLILMIKKEI